MGKALKVFGEVDAALGYREATGLEGRETEGIDIKSYKELYGIDYPIVMPRSIYSVKEFADHFKIHPNTVRRWIKDKKIRAEQSGGKGGCIFITVEEAHKYKMAQSEKSGYLFKDFKGMSCVYVIRFREFYKIGCTSQLRQRITELGVNLPEEPEIFAIIQCEIGEERKVEGQLHRAFHKKRVRGEWFNLDARDLSLIVEFKNDMDKSFIINRLGDG